MAIRPQEVGQSNVTPQGATSDAVFSQNQSTPTAGPMDYNTWLTTYGNSNGQNRPAVSMDQMLKDNPGLTSNLIDIYSTKMRGDYANANGLMFDKAPGVYDYTTMPTYQNMQASGVNMNALMGGNAPAPSADQVYRPSNPQASFNPTSQAMRPSNPVGGAMRQTARNWPARRYIQPFKMGQAMPPYPGSSEQFSKDKQYMESQATPLGQRMIK